MTRDDLFRMPSLGADMEEGRITEWTVAPGDDVTRGQIVVVVETDKSDIEVEVFDDGHVVELLVDEGTVVPVGEPIARIAAIGAPSASGPADAVSTRSSAHVTSPLVRHLADELHVDAAHLTGSGPGGRIARDDVVAAARGAARPTSTVGIPPIPPVPHAGARITPRARRLMAERGLAVETFAGRDLVTGNDVLAERADRAAAEPSTRDDQLRRRIASLMATSWAEIPHYHVSDRLDLTTVLDRLAASNEQRPIADRIVPGAVLLCAAARAAASVPECNGWWRDGRVERADRVDLGVVLSLRGGGVIVPTIRHADELPPHSMMERLGELVRRARQGRLKASDLAEASITITNLGDRGAESVAGIIHPPQVGLLGLGTVRDDVWAVDGEIAVRPTVHATFAGDHRATDGLAGSRFLAALQHQLDGPIADAVTDPRSAPDRSPTEPSTESSTDKE